MSTMWKSIEDMSIDELKVNEAGVIIDCTDFRLMEHGFVKGTPFYIYKKIYGMTCIHIRGAIIAFRNNMCRQILV